MHIILGRAYVLGYNTELQKLQCGREELFTTTMIQIYAKCCETRSKM